MPMHHNAAIVVLATLVTKAAGYATLPKTGSRKDFAPVDTKSESVERVVPDVCEAGDGCPCASSSFGCKLLGTGNVDPRIVEVDDINYCYDYCFADGDLFKSTTGGKAPCYDRCVPKPEQTNAAIMWQQEACSDTYELDQVPGSVFNNDNSLCAGGVVSADFCDEYIEAQHVNVFLDGTCQKHMRIVRNDGKNGVGPCDTPYTDECMKTACDSLLYIGTNSMNGGVASFCQYDEDTNKCNALPAMQIDDLGDPPECTISFEVRRKLEEAQQEARRKLQEAQRK